MYPYVFPQGNDGDTLFAFERFQMFHIVEVAEIVGLKSRSFFACSLTNFVNCQEGIR